MTQSSLTQISLTQKERMFLEDQRSHEELCIQKYQRLANQAQDPVLKDLFNFYSTKEQEHLNTINQILSGSLPELSGGGQSMVPTYTDNVPGNTIDYQLCSDALSTEKYISSVYNTSIFEFRDHQTREILNHIQKEEQEHGEGIFNYMASRGMYNPK